jgi:type VI secretion system protein ImpA
MNELIEKLLEKVSADQPCGPDLTNDKQFADLETLLKGKPEIDFGTIQKPAEPPNWVELQEKSAEFLKKSKHLRAAVTLCCCWLKTAGLAGFRDGLELIQGLLVQYWGTLYPALDPNDNHDPEQRLNILQALTAPRGTVTGWLTIIDYLYAAPLCQIKGVPTVDFEQIQAAKLKQAGDPSAPANAPSPESVGGVLRAASAQVVAHHAALEQSLEKLRAIDQFLTNTLTAARSMNFDDLQKTLERMKSSLEPYLPGVEAKVEQASQPTGGNAGGAHTEDVGIHIVGSIRSRDDVVKALENICQYYEQVEPGSPVPWLLDRAKKMTRMNFVQAVQELSLITDLSALRPSMGSALDSITPPATPAA